MELSEEEKKAIELLKNKNTEYYYRFIDVRDAVSTLLNLIEKQQKEIERLKYDREFLYGVIDELKENQVFIDDIKDHRIVYIDTPEFEEKFISKDKIREKIKELKKCKDISQVVGSIVILEELLEE